MAAFYLQAATILDQLEQKNDSLKALVAKTSGDRETAQNQRKRLLAVCANTLAYKQVLSLALDRSTILRSPAAVQALKKGGAQPPGNSGGNGSAERTAGGGGPSRKKQKLVSGAVNSAPSQSSSAPTSQSLLLVLLHDLLISGKIQTAQTYPPTAFLMANKARLHAELVRIQINKGVPSLIGLRSDQEQRAKVARIPRWIRLNTPKLSGTGNGDASARESFEAWLEAGRKGLTKCSAEENVLPSKRNYAESHHIRNVYALPSSYTSQLLASEPYQDGQVILQDLASCFPAQILVDHFERHHIARKKKGKANSGVALDATAAPGNKTSHLSALLHELCKKHQSLSISLTALEHDQGRFRTLRSQMQKAGTLSGNEKPTGVSSKPKSPTSLAQGPGALNVECRKQDFLATDPTTEGSDWARTVMLMLDPSCSGSGILGRLDHLSAAHTEEPAAENETDTEDASEARGNSKRLAQLAAFQLNMIRHAMTFPRLRCFTYSTCSVHREENEEVVARALELPEAIKHGWKLAPKSEVLPTWPHRGLPTLGLSDDQSESLVRTEPGGAKIEKEGEHVEATNGFFVCLFTRDG